MSKFDASYATASERNRRYDAFIGWSSPILLLQRPSWVRVAGTLPRQLETETSGASSGNMKTSGRRELESGEVKGIDKKSPLGYATFTCERSQRYFPRLRVQTARRSRYSIVQVGEMVVVETKDILSLSLFANMA